MIEIIAVQIKYFFPIVFRASRADITDGFVAVEKANDGHFAALAGLRYNVENRRNKNEKRRLQFYHYARVGRRGFGVAVAAQSGSVRTLFSAP